MLNFLEGYKTWVGIVASVLGMVGLGYLISADQMAIVIDSALKIFGVALAVYGNYKSHKKIAELK